MEQITLINTENIYETLWRDMPVYRQEDLTPHRTVYVHFACEADVQRFEELIEQKLLQKAKYVWYPKPSSHRDDVNFHDLANANEFPIYVISKGRHETRVTPRELEALGIPYRIVVEPVEYEKYAAVIDPAKILTLPFSDLGQGSIPARNWVWEHSIEEGHSRHWILDDNLQGFYRMKFNEKKKIAEGNPFEHVERFVKRYTNVGFAGMNYEFFAPRREALPPFYMNTRIYSCILVDNSLPFRWRGRHNEDTDICLRALKAGYCTFLSNAVLCKKITTMTMKGGNTDTVYASGDNRREFAESLKRQHPDCVEVTFKFGRWHHQVDYSSFRRNRLVEREGTQC